MVLYTQHDKQAKHYSNLFNHGKHSKFTTDVQKSVQIRGVFVVGMNKILRISEMRLQELERRAKIESQSSTLTLVLIARDGVSVFRTIKAVIPRTYTRV
jgi:hypothetical protein